MLQKPIGKKYCFYMPECNPDGLAEIDAHDDLQQRLVKEFKGYVATLTETCFLDGEILHDDSYQYSVVLEDESHAAKLVSIVKEFGARIGQDFIYVTDPHNNVYSVEC